MNLTSRTLPIAAIFIAIALLLWAIAGALFTDNALQPLTNTATAQQKGLGPTGKSGTGAELHLSAPTGISKFETSAINNGEWWMERASQSANKDERWNKLELSAMTSILGLTEVQKKRLQDWYRDHPSLNTRLIEAEAQYAQHPDPLSDHSLQARVSKLYQEKINQEIGGYTTIEDVSLLELSNEQQSIWSAHVADLESERINDFASRELGRLAEAIPLVSKLKKDSLFSAFSSVAQNLPPLQITGFSGPEAEAKHMNHLRVYLQNYENAAVTAVRASLAPEEVDAYREQLHAEISDYLR